MKRLLLAIFILSVPAQQCLAYDYEFFSGEKCKVLTSDPAQPLIRSLFTRSAGGYFKPRNFWDVGLGGELPLLSASGGAGQVAGLNVRGDFRSRLMMKSRTVDLLNADYTGGLNLVGKRPFGLAGDLEVYIYHQSSHLGDDAVFGSDGFFYRRMNYSREVLRVLYYGALPGSASHAYGAHYILRKDPAAPRGRLVLHYNITVPLGRPEGRFFISSDLQSNEEHSWNADANLQFGMKLGDRSKQVFLQKLVLEFYYGYSRQGQFYDKRERHLSLGIIAHL